MIHYNPKAYRERSVPRPLDEVREEVGKFCDAVQELAQKHGIADVTLCALANVTLPPADLADGQVNETSVQLVVHFGDTAKAVECAAYAHAYLRAEEEAYRLRIKAQAEQSAKKSRGT